MKMGKVPSDSLPLPPTDATEQIIAPNWFGLRQIEECLRVFE
jgi:hypothetical protein